MMPTTRLTHAGAACVAFLTTTVDIPKGFGAFCLDVRFFFANKFDLHQLLAGEQKATDHMGVPVLAVWEWTNMFWAISKASSGWESNE